MGNVTLGIELAQAGVHLLHARAAQLGGIVVAYWKGTTALWLGRGHLCSAADSAASEFTLQHRAWASTLPTQSKACAAQLAVHVWKTAQLSSTRAGSSR